MITTLKGGPFDGTKMSIGRTARHIGQMEWNGNPCYYITHWYKVNGSISNYVGHSPIKECPAQPHVSWWKTQINKIIKEKKEEKRLKDPYQLEKEIVKLEMQITKIELKKARHRPRRKK